MSTIRQSATFEQAHNAAHHMSLPWIRSVFRELCYQLWKENWKVEHVVNDDEGNNNNHTAGEETKVVEQWGTPQQTAAIHCRLYVTKEMIDQAQAMCRRLADRWSQRMQDVGHFEVARWIQDVVQREMSTFFAADEFGESDGNSSNNILRLNNLPGQDQDDGDNDNAPQQPPPTPPRRKESPKNMGILAALRELELPSDGALTQAQQEQYVIDQLDEMGYSGKTYWPYDWEDIQEATRKMPQRLYSHSSAEYGNTLKLKLVPKSIVQAEEKDETSHKNSNTQPRGAEEDELPNKDEASKWTERMVVKYKQRGPFPKKKRKVGQPATTNKTNSNNKRHKTRPLVMEASRPANPLERTQIPWNKNVAAEIADSTLDAYVHPNEDDDDEDNAICHTLLGALKPLGHVHHTFQFPVDHPKGQKDQQQEDRPLLTERMKKRKFTRSVMERVGIHQTEKVVTANKVRSKIKYSLKDTGSSGTIGQNQRHEQLERWWDMDLGECLLDLQDGKEEGSSNGDGDAASSSRKLYAFSSLEISLRDEDEKKPQEGCKKGVFYGSQAVDPD